MSAAVGDDGEEQKVVLRVYDLSNGMARTMSQQLLGMQVDIVPHTGVFVYGREWCAAESGGNPMQARLQRRASSLPRVPLVPGSSRVASSRRRAGA